MEDILKETIGLAKNEISKREKLNTSELEKRAKSISNSAIIYGDLKNFRLNNVIFDIQRFLDFEGNTGPYLLYTYARAKSTGHLPPGAPHLRFHSSPDGVADIAPPAAYHSERQAPARTPLPVEVCLPGHARYKHA